MNYLISYRTTEANVVTIKTFTYAEAEAIANYAFGQCFKDVSITPLNDSAVKQMEVFHMVTGIADCMFRDFPISKK